MVLIPAKLHVKDNVKNLSQGKCSGTARSRTVKKKKEKDFYKSTNTSTDTK